jgi:uncharacterized membrane protein YfcA
MKLADVVRAAKSFKMSDAHRFAHHVVPEVVRPARVIWNQAIGGLFLLFTVFFLGCAFNYYRQSEVDPKSGLGFGLALFMGVVMAYFSVASFLKARKIARPRASGRA